MADVLRSDIPAAYFDKILEAKRKGRADDLYIIDVRDDWERNEIKVPFSLGIPCKETRRIPKMSSTEFKERYGVEKPTRNSFILLVCEGERRSATMQEFLREKGFKHVYRLVGGLERWKEVQDGAYDEDL